MNIPYTVELEGTRSFLRLVTSIGELIIDFDDALVRAFVVGYKNYLHHKISQIKTRVIFDGPNYVSLYSFHYGLSREERNADLDRKAFTLADFLCNAADWLDLLEFASARVPMWRHLKQFPCSTPVTTHFVQHFVGPQVDILKVYHNPKMPSIVKLEQIVDHFEPLVASISFFYTAYEHTNRGGAQRNAPKRLNAARVLESVTAPTDFVRDVHVAWIGDWLIQSMVDMPLRRRLERIALLAEFDAPDLVLEALGVWEKNGWEGQEIAESYLNYF